MGSKNTKIVAKVKLELTVNFKIVNMGLINFYLGLIVNKNCIIQTIKFCQPTYIQKVLTKYYFNKVNTIYIPIKKVLLGPNLLIKVIKSKNQDIKK